MKVFLPLGNSAQVKPSEINAAIRGAVERYWGGLRPDSFLSMTQDREDQFFLKSSQRFIVWGKIFFEPMSREKEISLSQEYEHLSRNFSQPLRPCIFFNQSSPDFQPSGLPCETSFFQYTLIESKGEKAMLIKPVSLLKTEKPLSADQGASSPVGRSGSGILRQAQLTQSELSELISLSLDLKHS